MKNCIALTVLGAVVLGCGGMDSATAPESETFDAAAIGDRVAATGAKYTGRGVAVEASVNGQASVLCNASPLPRDGGRVEYSSKNAIIAGVLVADSLYCITTGGGNRSISEATLVGVRVTVEGNVILARNIHSMSGALCPPFRPGPSSQGHAVVNGLVVNGREVFVRRNAPNQRINLPNGYIIADEQSSFVTQWHAGRTVIGLRIVTPGSTIVLGLSQQHIDCP